MLQKLKSPHEDDYTSYRHALLERVAVCKENQCILSVSRFHSNHDRKTDCEPLHYLLVIPDEILYDINALISFFPMKINRDSSAV